MFIWKDGTRTYTTEDLGAWYGSIRKINNLLKKGVLIERQDKRWVPASGYIPYTLELPSAERNGLHRWGWSEDGLKKIEEILTKAGCVKKTEVVPRTIYIDFPPYGHFKE